jgi:selenocysteine lyase/cysteine desulfurase
MTSPFPVCDHLVHLNHAAVGPWPFQTAERVRLFAAENAQQGSLDYPRWLKVERDLREKIQILINASNVDEIALVKNTSEGLSMVAYGLPWQAGDNIVGIRQEFPSNRVVWESLAPRGVEFRQLDLEQSDDPEASLMGLCDEHTRLIAISAVQYANGFKMNLERVGRFCRDQGILFCVDAIQQIGALPFDVQAIHADFAVADGHKWMLAAEGLGLFFVRKELLQRLELTQYGWHMMNPIADYAQSDFEIANSARRFECGSPNMLGIFALESSLGLLLEQGIEQVGVKVLQHTKHLIEGLSQISGIQLLTDTTTERLSGIVTFRPRKIAAEAVYRHLMEQKILCAARGGGVRLSPHFYLPASQIEHALQVIEQSVAD